MASIEITSFFTNAGSPALSINTDTPGYPKVQIFEINGTTSTIIVGAPSGTGSNTDGVQTASGAGFYTFVFTDLIGYNESKKYLVRVDGGPSLPATDRFQSGSVEPALSAADVQNVAQETSATVWNETLGTFTTPGSVGYAINQIRANTEQLALDVIDVTALLNLLLKYETNRTRIDTTAKTLTVYDDDCATVLRVFQLRDSFGNASTDQVCERLPIAATDGKAVC